MSGFLGLTPTIQIVLDNPLLGIRYPQYGSVNAIIDTGYEGFVMLPKPLFLELGLSKLRNERRRVTMANKTVSESQGAYAVLEIAHLSFRIDGFVETLRGLDEIIVGVEALVRTNLVLDYCAKRVSLEKCP